MAINLLAPDATAWSQLLMLRSGDPVLDHARVDGALTGLHVGAHATALFARIDEPHAQAAAGLRTLRWSSAGHLPPLFIQPRRQVQVLNSSPERLLGTDTHRPAPRPRDNPGPAPR